MNVQIQAVHFDADTKLTERVNQKLEKLRTFHDRIIDVEVYLILDNVAHKLKDKIAEIKVHVPRHSFFVKHQSKTFEESFDFAFDSLVNQIKRHKERQAVTPVQMPE
jgi:putative sigma-54 modulation protein